LSVGGDAAAPRVTIAVAAYNAQPWVGEAIESALAQTLENIELVVVDDASTDGTGEIVRTFTDPRIRVFHNEVNLGQSATWNRAIALARAPLIKFLCADDALHPYCVERLSAPFASSSNVGLAFSRRSIAREGGVYGSDLVWEEYETMFRRFGPLNEVNDGRRLFATLLAARFDDNWVGEPTNVMVRRDVFGDMRGFHPYIRQPVDLELWLRLMFHYAVGFVDEALATYRLVDDSVTHVTARTGAGWADRLWLVESLWADNRIRHAHPELHRLLWLERRRAAAQFARSLWRTRRVRRRISEGAAYLAYLMQDDAVASWTPPLTPPAPGHPLPSR
jgi:glycosyltransferase involved in cell wall biosynthesis